MRELEASIRAHISRCQTACWNSTPVDGSLRFAVKTDRAVRVLAEALICLREDTTSYWLAGTSSFVAKDFAVAIAHYECARLRCNVPTHLAALDTNLAAALEFSGQLREACATYCMASSGGDLCASLFGALCAAGCGDLAVARRLLESLTSQWCPEFDKHMESIAAMYSARMAQSREFRVPGRDWMMQQSDLGAYLARMLAA